MRIIKTVLVEREECTELTCDKCGKTVNLENIFEWQEWFSYSTTGGYGASIGDGTTVEIDLCQVCFKNVLGPYLRDVTDYGDTDI